jgi:hypothetical protein
VAERSGLAAALSPVAGGPERTLAPFAPVTPAPHLEMAGEMLSSPSGRSSARAHRSPPVREERSVPGRSPRSAATPPRGTAAEPAGGRRPFVTRAYVMWYLARVLELVDVA